jgi:hypothetical protein
MYASVSPQTQFWASSAWISPQQGMIYFGLECVVMSHLKIDRFTEPLYSRIHRIALIDDGCSFVINVKQCHG